MKINPLLPCALGLAFGLGISALAPSAQAAPRSKTKSSRLEIWPGQRTLVVLPLMVSENFLSTGGDTAATPTATSGSTALSDALKNLLAPQLSDALKMTGKFSVTRPYKFDPLLRRALLEGLDEATANAYIEDPSRSSAQTLLSALRLEQPGMVAQVVIQSLIVGGTPAAPTVQMSVRGDLYEAGSAEPFRSINTTSKPFGGATPDERIRAAAGQAFADIAAAFIEPPVEFELPLPLAPASGMMTGTPSNGATVPSTMPPTGPSVPMPDSTAPVMPAPNPQMPNGTLGTPIAPMLPGSTPPLGVNVPEEE